jgi:hypothetical protein
VSEKINNSTILNETIKDMNLINIIGGIPERSFNPVKRLE